MKQIGIIGVGWLGEKLFKLFKSESFKVVGTVSSSEKAEKLSDNNHKVYRFRLGDDVDKLVSFANLEYIIITIPPSSHTNYGTELSKVIECLMMTNPNASIIYTSSTSVYGNSEKEVDETSPRLPMRSNAVKIVEVESFLEQHMVDQRIVLRLAGLVGGKRHPVHFLSGRKNIAKPYSPINLVHREDIVRFIKFIVDRNVRKGVFNLCCEEHPTKQKYYQWVAEQKKITIPEFNLEDKLKDKTVTCKAIKQTDFYLKYKSPYDFPN